MQTQAGHPETRASFTTEVDALARKLHAAHIMRAVWIGVLLAGTGTWLLMVLDYVYRPIYPLPRHLLSAAFWGIIATCACLVLHIAFWRRPSRYRVARRWESLHTPCSDTVSCAVEFADEPVASGNSPELRAATTVLAGRYLHESSEGEAGADLSSAPWLKVSAAVMCAALLLHAVTRPRHAFIGLQRLTAPRSQVAWPRHHELAFRNLPAQVMTGSDLALEVIDRSGHLPDRVTLFLRDPKRPDAPTKTTLRPDRAGRHRYPIPDVLASIEVRAAGGDHLDMPWHRIAVEAPPECTSCEWSIEPPDYLTTRPPPATDALRMVEGSTLVVRGTADRDLSRVRLFMGDQTGHDACVAEADATGKTFQIHWSPHRTDVDRASHLMLSLCDEDHLENAQAQLWALSVQADRPPSVEWKTLPSPPPLVTPNGQLELQVVAHDDFGLSAAFLEFQIQGQADGQRDLAGSVPAAMPASRTRDGATDDHRAWRLTWSPQASLEDRSWNGNDLPTRAQLTVRVMDLRQQNAATPPRVVSVVSRTVFLAELLRRTQAVTHDLRDIRDRQQHLLETTGLTSDAPRRPSLKSLQADQNRILEELVRPTISPKVRLAQIERALDLNRCADTPLMTAIQRSLLLVAAAAARITDGLQALESASFPSPGLSPAWATAINAQRKAIAALDELLMLWDQVTNRQELVDQLVEIRSRQRTLREDTAVWRQRLLEGGSAPPQAIAFEALAGRQSELRSDWLEARNRMRRLASRMPAGRGATAIRSVVKQSSFEQVAIWMTTVTQHLSRQQAFRAWEEQQPIMDTLDRLLRILRNAPAASETQNAASNWKELEQRLIRLHAQVSESTWPQTSQELLDLAAQTEAFADRLNDSSQTHAQQELRESRNAMLGGARAPSADAARDDLTEALRRMRNAGSALRAPDHNAISQPTELATRLLQVQALQRKLRAATRQIDAGSFPDPSAARHVLAAQQRDLADWVQRLAKQESAAVPDSLKSLLLSTGTE